MDGEAIKRCLDGSGLRCTPQRVAIVHEAPRTAGFGAELAALVAEKALLHLQAPVLRVTGYDVPYPYWQLEDLYVPSVERVSGAVRTLLDF